MSNLFKTFLQKEKITFIENKILAPLMTWRVGGPAKYFIVIKDEKTLLQVLNINRKTDRLPILVLGGGSNLLISDEGFKGIVLKITLDFWQVQNFKNHFKVRTGAGIKLSRLVEWARDNKLNHVAVFAKIPGTIGGAVVGNAGAWNYCVANYISKVIYYDFLGKKNIFKKSSEDFSYRQSFFKKKESLIISEVEFKISKKSELDFYSVKKNLEYRSKNQPKGFSAGCVFANPKNNYAGKLIAEAGCKGLSIGDAYISPLHSNFFINRGKASASDIYKLIQKAKAAVKNKFGIDLKEEIRCVGKF